jgi:uncharacterized spore protein YtfJ
MKKPVKKMGGGMMSPRKEMAMGLKSGGMAKKKSVIKKRGGGMKHGGVAHSRKSNLVWLLQEQQILILTLMTLSRSRLSELVSKSELVMI